ncbi:hypothetical protein [uncultured Winogradskyella sp.]|uniref:hypothetical protein n=1 Tax=uncultured Winogradskyella sp. TaxID=395353 RepID=UPI0030DD4568
MKKSSIVLLLLILLISKFWIGVFEHDEFNYKVIFIKHRAIWKTYFYSPRGMSDLKIKDLTVKEQTEQILFDEFVVSNFIRD